MFEWVGRFNYIGILMDRSDDDWPSVLHSIRKSRQVWGGIGEILWSEWAETEVSEQFYCEIIQSVILFRAETWVITEKIIQKL